jgi:two-component system NtrC family response regulator
VRVVSATHQDLAELIKEGRFREDLYYRISEIAVGIPAIRQREGEAGVLASYFLNKEAQQLKKGNLSFSPDAIAAINAYDWPGNVRELANRIKRAVILAEGKQITAQGLELAVAETESLPLNLREVREQAESRALLSALEQAEGNVSQAAGRLGITRPTFYALAKKYQLDIGQTGT